MKRILGLDLGISSIGWALVEEGNNKDSKIIKLGVRVNPLSTEEKINFESGKPISTNANRTVKRGARRSLDRYQMRRDNLIKLLINKKFISKETPLTEIGKNTTYQTLSLRSKAARTKISLEDLAKSLLAINKKRGYKSSRKTKDENDGAAVDGMAVAKILYDEKLFPGEYTLNLLKQGKKIIPDFYPSDLKAEFNAIWKKQREFYPNILNDKLYHDLQGKNKGETWAICSKHFQINSIKLKENKTEQKLQCYQFRVEGLKRKINLENLVIALQEINNTINSTSDYLGKISDRSKVLYINKLTVGEYLFDKIKKKPHVSLKNQVFYQQDYLDEFEQIWETQAKFHPQLTPVLKTEIRDLIIFYQRPLKSKKGLLNFCLFERWEQEYYDVSKEKKRKRIVGQKVIPKSSPLYQEFKIWQNINDIEFIYIGKDKHHSGHGTKTYKLDEEDRILLFNEANIRENLSATSIFKLLGISSKNWKLNYKNGIEGNTTNEKLFKIYQEIALREGYNYDLKNKSAIDIIKKLKIIFSEIGIDLSILDFDTTLQGNEFSKQTSYELWHLLYSTSDETIISEEDKLIYGNSDVSLKKKLHQKYGFAPIYATMLANLAFSNDYGSLSARAIKKIIPYLKEGLNYSNACYEAGYKPSNNLIKEENKNTELKKKLEILEKNSLRNPVIEKILNQMINLINQVIDTYGKPNEIRIELKRDLKKSTKERLETIKYINSATKVNLDIAKIIKKEFNFTPTKNDITKYKLWQELAPRGYKSLFSNKYIAKEDIFSNKIDIDHILPKAIIHDDSYSNKILVYRNVNLKKANRTAIDFITQDYSATVEEYIQRVETLYNKGKGTIKKGKRNRLLKSSKNIKEGFIARDLRNSQYIAKKARNILLEVFSIVTPTTEQITNKLREEWGIINVIKEMNIPKYKELGLVHIEERKNGKKIEKIKDWTKRNDHRYQAINALAIAFTTNNHIQYINNFNIRQNKDHQKYKLIQNIENLITHKIKDDKGNYKRKFIKPMPKFRTEAIKHLAYILVSFKAKNKVVTRNVNKTKKENGFNTNLGVTPRGQLHNETIYGKSKRPKIKATKINKRFTLEEVKNIIHNGQRNLILNYLKTYDNNTEIAFDTKTLKKNPVIWNNEILKEILCYEEVYTIRKDITPDLKIAKVLDEKIKNILKKRKEEFKGNTTKAFSNLDKNPIWLNKEKGIQIKRVTIYGISNAEPLHHKKNHLGATILNKDNKKIPVDFVSLGNNHHIAIYKDSKGKLQEKSVSLFEAVERVNQKSSIIDKRYNAHLGWKFLFTMKQNEMFVFPSDTLNPSTIDLKNQNNTKLISPNLFRVQKIATKNYSFRHHLETNVDTVKELSGIAYKSQLGLNSIEGIIKVRINHIGEIVKVGEY